MKNAELKKAIIEMGGNPAVHQLTTTPQRTTHIRAIMVHIRQSRPGLINRSQGQNLALTVFCVPSSLELKKGNHRDGRQPRGKRRERARERERERERARERESEREKGRTQS